MRRHLYVIKVFFVLLALFAAEGKTSVAENQLSGKALIDSLRQGGYTIYFRHAATDWSQDDHVVVEGDWTS